MMLAAWTCPIMNIAGILTFWQDKLFTNMPTHQDPGHSSAYVQVTTTPLATCLSSSSATTWMCSLCPMILVKPLTQLHSNGGIVVSLVVVKVLSIPVALNLVFAEVAHAVTMVLM